MLRKCLRELACGKTHAATGIQYQRRAALCSPCSDTGGKGSKVDIGDRLAELRCRVSCDNGAELFMRTGLIALNRSGIGVHRTKAYSLPYKSLMEHNRLCHQ